MLEYIWKKVSNTNQMRKIYTTEYHAWIIIHSFITENSFILIGTTCEARGFTKMTYIFNTVSKLKLLMTHICLRFFIFYNF